MLNKILKTISILLLPLTLLSCSEEQSKQHQMFVFGTIVDITIWHNNESETTQAIKAISETFNKMHYHWHAWKPGRLHKINQALRRGEAVTLDSTELEFLNTTIKLAKQSNHYFNPVMGELINLWGFHSDDYPILTPPPLDAEIKELVDKNITVNDLTLTGNVLSSKNPQVWLDFGGIAKGYAVDQAIEILKTNNIKNAIINAGGDIRSMGQNKHQPWRIGIQSPKDWSMLAAVTGTNTEAVFTSGNYQRYKEYNGERYAHIIHPETGEPVDKIISATVIAANGIIADAAATALLVAGEQWPKTAQQLGITQVLIIDENHLCFTTEEMLMRLKNSKIECTVID